MKYSHVLYFHFFIAAIDEVEQILKTGYQAALRSINYIPGLWGRPQSPELVSRWENGMYLHCKKIIFCVIPLKKPAFFQS